jgi:hypothetical protein
MTLPESDIAFKQVLKQSDIALQRFHSHVKRFILICRGVAIAAKLPGTDRRDKLEEAAWAALQDAVEWMKTEEATENARARAMVAASLIEKEEKSGVSHSDLHTNSDRAIKRFMLTYQMPVGVAGLPAKEKRDDLEKLSWQAALGADKYAKA